MISVVIIGSGNVANHLILAFCNHKSIDLVQVYSRKSSLFPDCLPDTKITHDLSSLAKADVYIIAVSDNAIAEISSKLPFGNRLVVHTSGSMPLEILDKKNNRGVFYPLQTFSKEKEIKFNQVPICIEATQKKDLEILNELASKVVEKTYKISSEQRKSLHIAAVFVSNFVNHLYKIGNDICTEKNVPFEILKPLIEETANKINFLSPSQAQTGPAKRKDTKTIEEHLNSIKDENQKEIYKLLTQSIINHG